GQPAVNPTSHPLVFLYSAPPCEKGQRMRVQFQGPDGVPHQTPFQNCASQLSMNFYLAGVYPGATYVARQILDTGSQFLTGPEVSFTTGNAPADLVSEMSDTPPQAAASNQVVLASPLGRPVATDLNGNVLWFGRAGVSFLTRPEPRGYFWGIGE